MFLIFLAYRIIKTRVRSSDDSKFSVYPLKRLLENKINTPINEVFIEDYPVDYDLFGYDNTIILLRNAIVNSKPKNSFTIGLFGSWGSGKTTIIKNALRGLGKEYVQVDFNPMEFSGKEKIVVEYYRKIWSALMYESENDDYSQSAKSLAREITGKPTISIDDFIPGDEAEQAIKMINSRLKINDSYLVIVVDNIERCQADEILALLSIMNDTRIERAIYILSYERETLGRHLREELHMNETYLEKIVNMEIQILGSKEIQLVLKRCIKNLLVLKGSNKLISNDLDRVVVILSPLVVTPRDLIRFLNSALIPSLADERKLNVKELILLNYTKLKDNSLYEYLRDNKQYLAISGQTVSAVARTDLLNFLIAFPKKYPAFSELLCLLFPIIDAYYRTPESARQNFLAYGPFSMKADFNSVENITVANPLYFDMYFNADMKPTNQQEFEKRLKNVKLDIGDGNGDE